MKLQPQEKVIQHIDTLFSAIESGEIINDILMATIRRDIKNSQIEEASIICNGLISFYFKDLDNAHKVFMSGFFKFATVANNYLYLLTKNYQFSIAYELTVELRKYQFHVSHNLLKSTIMLSVLYCDIDLLSAIFEVLNKIDKDSEYPILTDEKMDKNAQESFKKIVIDAAESTNSTPADVRKSLDIAFEILSEKNTKIVSFSPPELLVPMLILHIDADVESVVDMNFELADAMTYVDDSEIKCPVYFSKSVETLRGMRMYAD